MSIDSVVTKKIFKADISLVADDELTAESADGKFYDEKVPEGKKWTATILITVEEEDA